MGKKVAIVGAGVSGLAAAWSLREIGVEVSVFEKSRGVSGRAASRTKNGVRFDHGANYFKIESEEIEELVLNRLPTADLARIEKDIWTFDAAGVLSPGDPALNAETKWTYRSGISKLGKLLAETSGTTVENGVQVRRIMKRDSAWEIFSDGESLGDFDAILVTVPAPQASEILEQSQLPDEAIANLTRALGEAEYHRQFSVILAVDGKIERPGDFFALLNSDRKHDIAWLSFENDKSGHVETGETVLVVQMAPEWSADRFEISPQEFLPEVIEKTSRILDARLSPAWWDIQRWKFAHPYSKADCTGLRAIEDGGMFFAGDALVGKGRVHLAIESGLEAGERIRNFCS